jgi:hypothetical protein
MSVFRHAFLTTATLVFSAGLFAKDFNLESLKQASRPTFDLAESAGKMSYYKLMQQSIYPKMSEAAESAKPGSTNESELQRGNGVSVKLSENNFNIHINFPLAPTGGRSYGWTGGQVGDWSDKMYLDNLAKVTKSGDKRDLARFYEVIVKTLGACDAGELETLKRQSQRVATNFIAIYTAEEYRSMVPVEPHRNWDDALLETTLLGAFHGGQSDFAKFYLGKFTDTSKVQASGVYAKTKPGPTYDSASSKHAEMNDYWQFSADPASIQSGINVTRKDFELLGKAITRFESVHQNPNLLKLQRIIGRDDNVIKGISKFFTANKSKNVGQIDELATLVSNLMIDIYDDADQIGSWLKSKQSAAELN